MSMVFFEVGATDFSSAVDRQSYAVNLVNVEESWTDAAWTEHRRVVRTRIQGTLTLGYASAADFAAAVSAIASALSSTGYASCTLLCNNDGTTHTGDCYLTILGTGQWDVTNSRQWQTLTVEVSER